MKCVELTKGYVAIISTEDWRRIKKYKWHVHVSKGKNKKPGQPYARTTIDGKKVYMHRFITGAFEPMHVDHKNHCTLDNRRENLQILTHEENQRRRRNIK